nr:PREDICTED: GTP-binding protein REM 2 isoform X2 [Equus przewalskii]
MYTDLDTDMDTDTETTALCPSGSHQASPPGTPTPDATLLKKPEKLLAGLDRGGPPLAPGAPRRRGSMPVPYKHQLLRAQAVDELDWPPQASSSGSSDSLGSGEAAPTQKDGIFKVMLVGESGVGKSTLAGTFGGLQGDSAHEPENPEDTYERRIMVDKEEVTLVVYDIWEQVRTKMWLQAGDKTWDSWGGQRLAEGWWDCRPWFQHVLEPDFSYVSAHRAKAHTSVQIMAFESHCLSRIFCPGGKLGPEFDKSCSCKLG